MASAEPFNRLVKLTARAFYDNITTTKGDVNQHKSFRGDNSAMGVVVLDALTRRQWVREEDLAKALKLHSKQLRRILRFFEEEKLVMRHHRKESKKVAKAHNSTASASGDGQPVPEGEVKQKMHTHSYCCLDYAQICDVVRYRIHHMKKKLKDDLDSKNTIQQYICHRCNKRYSAFDALQLVSYTDDYFHCETCNGELVTVSDKLASEDTGDGEGNARKCRSDKLKDMQQRIDEQLKPLVAQLKRLKNLPAPEFGSLESWERANIGAFANGCPGAADSSRIPGNSEFKLVFDPIKGVDGKDDPGKDSRPVPPWMVNEAMNLSAKQRGQMPSKPDEISETKDDNKQKSEDEKSIEDEYIKAYYKALRKQEDEDAVRRMQHEGGTFISNSQTDRKVGKKYKWEDEDERIEGEEDQATGNTAEAIKLEAQESGDEDDGYEWVES